MNIGKIPAQPQFSQVAMGPPNQIATQVSAPNTPGRTPLPEFPVVQAPPKPGLDAQSYQTLLKIAIGPVNDPPTPASKAALLYTTVARQLEPPSR